MNRRPLFGDDNTTRILRQDFEVKHRSNPRLLEGFDELARNQGWKNFIEVPQDSMAWLWCMSSDPWFNLLFQALEYTIVATHKDLRGIALPRGYLFDAELCGSDFTSAFLDHVFMPHANLRNARFPGANLNRAILRRTDQTRADFTGAYLHGADITRANITETVFNNATLSEAMFTDSYLTGASFVGANLSCAWFNRTHLEGVDFTGADLKSTCFWGAQYDSTTRWPEGFTPKL